MKETGGHAFPMPRPPSHDGMTLRDYFAAKAMNALVTRGDYAAGMDLPSANQQWATLAFNIADRMLEVRKE